ncbi:helix-turn-helix domain-containing protein [Kitasatospora sp. NPDC093550]|uniref:helix-turn-helix domain-containing protein n=1 Tax=Kitasatospora sp. NPDC093550 TaxID=3364089 RepID=UPI003826A97F
MTEKLGPLLRGFRKQAGLTQEQLAERSGVSVSTIRRLENDRAFDHRVGTVHLLADALALGPEDHRRLAAALGRTEEAPAPGPPPPGPPPPDTPPAGRATPPARPRPGAAGRNGGLTDAADELAREIRRRWRREEEQRRVLDPFPLPVRWQDAPPGLTDHEANVQRLEPGAVPGVVDLSGDLRNAAEVYRRISSGRLVVLGRAGSGKSVLAIRFVLDLLSERGDLDPVPVIFTLGEWDPTAASLRDWLTSRLLRDHPHLARRVPSGGTLAAALVDADLVLPVLDGFDEIAEGLRCAALDALNAASLPLVLTSRRPEFAEAVDAAGTPLVWAAAIELTDLTVEDLADYLPRTVRTHGRATGGTDAGPGGASAGADGPTGVWDAVLAELRSARTAAGAHLAKVLSTPLMVILARTMYSDSRDAAPGELLDDRRFPTEHALEEHLLAGFVPTLYRRRAPERAVGGGPAGGADRDPEHARRWLGFLAHHLVRLDRDRHDLAWWRLADSLRLSTRTALVVLVSALCVAGAEWSAGLFLAEFGMAETLLQGALMGVVAGVAFGSVYAFMAGVGGMVFEPTRVRLRWPRANGTAGRRSIRTFVDRFVTVLLGGVILGTGCASALTLERAVFFGAPLADWSAVRVTLVNMPVFGLVFGLAGGLVFAFLAVFESPLDVASAATPTSLLALNRATVTRQVVLLVPLLSLAVAFGGRLVVIVLQPLLGPLGWSSADAVFIGVTGGVGGTLSYALGFTAWGQWLVFSRFWLPLTGRLPWDVTAFLDDAYRRGVLRRTGAVYQFRHVRLQHHLGDAFRRQQPGYAPARFAAPPPVPTDRPGEG